MSAGLEKPIRPLSSKQEYVMSHMTAVTDTDVKLEALAKQIRDYEAKGDYESAAGAARRMRDLKQSEELHTMEQLSNHHDIERASIQEAHVKELGQFNAFWDAKIMRYEKDCQDSLNALKTRQEAELNEFVKRLSVEVSTRRPRESKSVLILRKKQLALAKLKDYEGATVAKYEADAFQRRELSQWSKRETEQVNFIVSQFRVKQELELRATTDRIDQGRSEMNGRRSKELARILQRYHNVKCHLALQHSIDCKRVKFMLHNLPSRGCTPSVTPKVVPVSLPSGGSAVVQASVPRSKPQTPAIGSSRQGQVASA